MSVITRQEAIDILIFQKEPIDSNLAAAKLLGFKLAHTERLAQAFTLAIDALREGYKTECENCFLEKECPGYYDGCFDAVNGELYMRFGKEK